MQSISNNERIHAIDIVRGFAIFGIFLVNWPSLAGIESRELTGSYVGIDSYVRLFYDLFVQTKFYTIFSFLFGLGFYIFMTRAEAKTDRPKLLFVRRLLVLLVFGLLHYVLLWDGDILHTYAFCGFILLLFYKRKSGTVLTWALILLILYELLMLLAGVVMFFLPSTELRTLGTPVTPFQDWTLQVQNRFAELVSDVLPNLLFTAPEIVALFLLGLYAGKIDLFRRTKELDAKLKKWQIITFAVTVPILGTMIFYFSQADSYEPLRISPLTMLSGKTLFLFYIITLLRLLHHESWQKILNPLQYVGRMALTNYIFQTVLTLSVFGLLAKMGIIFPLWGGTLFCIIVFIAQIFLSRWWLSRFQHGPLENVWRLGTYGMKMSQPKQGEISG